MNDSKRISEAAEDLGYNEAPLMFPSVDTLVGRWKSSVAPLRLPDDFVWVQPKHVVGASLLCFMVDPHHGRMYFLLGKERHVPQWGEGSSRWSDFGGGRKGKETPETVAAREFTEETMGVVRYFEKDSISAPRRSWRDISLALKRNNYLRRYEIAFPHDADETDEQKSVKNVYVTYLKQIPWDPHVIVRFRHCRSLLSALRRQLQGLPFSVQESESLHPPNAALATKRQRWALHHPCVHVQWKTGVEIQALVDGAPRLLPSTHSVLTDASDTVVASMVTRESRALSLKRIPLVVGMNCDYFEKQCLGLFSVPNLQRALAYGGNMSHRDGSVESCRPCFLMVLSAVFEDLSYYFPTYFHDVPTVHI